MKKKLIILLGCFLSLFIVGGSFFFVNSNVENQYNDVILIDEPVINVGPSNEEIINNYVNIYNNDDVVGEINIVNTGYKKAIMQSEDNDYYLNHLEDKTSSYMGSVYLDFRVNIDNGKKLLIFGHNSDTIDMPFKILENYYSKDYYEAHKHIEIVTRNKTRLYEIYSIYVEVSDFGYMKTEFTGENEWYEHIKEFKDKSMYDTGVTVSENDDILILQTCSTHSDYRKYNKKYLLVVAKEVDSK